MKSLMYRIAVIAALTAALTGCNTKNDTLTQLTITPANQFMAKGTTQQFVANGTFSNGMIVNFTQVVTWSTSDPSVATVNNTAGSNGIVTSSTATGTTILTAFDVANDITGTVLLTVADPDSIQIVPPDSYIPVDGIHQFIAIALFSNGTGTQVITNFATWTLSSLSTSPVASITNAYGVAGNGTVVATAVTGTAIITASDPNSPATGSTMITVTSTPLTALTVYPASATISTGTTTQFSAVGTFQDLSTTLSLTATWAWSSSNPAVATIDYYTGIATAAQVGTTTITATDLITGVTGNTALAIQ
jgi:hypothetical protein